MIKRALIPLAKSVAITVGATVVALVTNAARPDGIPVVTDIPYEIFSACKDAEAASAAVSDTAALGEAENTLFVDVRPAAVFAQERVQGAVSLPYSALFGASDEDIARVRRAVESKKISGIVVYGTYREPGSTDPAVDLAQAAAAQLLESGIENVRHVEGGIAAMKKRGAVVVQGEPK